MTDTTEENRRPQRPSADQTTRAGDEAVLVQHGDKLQNLDIAVQTIAAVADLVVGDADEAATAFRLDNLRASYTQALDRRH